MTTPVKMYTLSTCSHCKSAKKFLGDHSVVYEFTDVDLLEGEARKSALDEIRSAQSAAAAIEQVRSR